MHTSFPDIEVWVAGRDNAAMKKIQFGDSRLDKVGQELHAAMTEQQTVALAK